MPKPSREVIKSYIQLHVATEKKKIFIQWIPAHAGILGNEIPDTYAKSAVGISLNELDTPQEYMMAGKVIQELNLEGFLSNRDATVNLFATKKNQAK
jgi:hypothetical protein